jgi:hypothetical protein
MARARSDPETEGREDAVIVVWMIGIILVGAVLLMLLSAVLSDLNVDSIGAALSVNVMASVSWYAYLFIAEPLLIPHLPEGAWIPTVVSHAVLTVLLAIGITFTPGIHTSGFSTLAAAVIVSFAELALMSIVLFRG